jgi:glutamate 5-kinase
MSERARAASAKRVVVKVGSGVLADREGGLDGAAVRRLAGELADARKAGREVVLVSSGAILAGRERLRLPRRPDTRLKQAAAAVGQSRLMRAWEAAFARHDLVAAQILLTADDLRERARYLNARGTLQTLLRLGAVPVVNENDTVAVDEIKFGDNDGLSALVAGLCDAGLLVLLTDQDGLYEDDPRRRPDARLVSRVGPDEPLPRAGRAGRWGTGGMESKVRAARQAASAGIAAVVANGTKSGVLAGILNAREAGTFFPPAPRAAGPRRRWLAFATRPKGRLTVDAGAREALSARGRSLLPSGVRAVSGAFAAGDVVGLEEGGVEFARGIVNFGARDLERIKGMKTSELEAALGRKAAGEVVHRDNLAVLRP